MIKSKQTIQELLADMKAMPAREKLELLEDLEKLEKRKKLQDARDDFLKFCHAVYPAFKEGPHHRHLNPKLKAICEGENGRMTVSMPPRFGKQLDHETPVLTQNRGWVRHGDLVVGDKVFHPSGAAVEVIWLGPELPQDCEVEFGDGALVRCHENHEWTVYDSVAAIWRTVETQWLERQALKFDGEAAFWLPPVSMPQVSARQKIGVTAVRRVAPSVGRCIQVDAEDGLYLVGRQLTPTHNSETISYMFVAWYLGHHPTHHVMMVTHTATLSSTFGRKIRNLIDSPIYQEIFPKTQVSKDKSAADDWTTTAGGKYLAIGVGANVAGHGAHLCLDPNAEVLTVNGSCLLKDIVVDNTLLTAQGRHKVTKKMLTTHTEGVSINEALLASGTHPFYTQRGWVPAGQLRLGDRIETRTVWAALWDKAKHTLRKILRLKHGVA